MIKPPVGQKIDASSIKDISGDMFISNKKIKLLPAEYYRALNWDDFRVFCHNHGRYGIPTIEMIHFLRFIINGRKSIEIGAGHGDLGYYLEIPVTDVKLQNNPVVALEYMLIGQPVIDYPADVIEIDAISAALMFRPQVVIGSWVTAYGNPEKESYGCNIWGINENAILEFPFVETYILIGNIDQHGDKPIMSIPHEMYDFDWHVSRAKNQEKNRIWIWKK